MTSNDPVRPEPPAARNSASDPLERVGYGHPPLHSRFKPGQSGNPSGRPRARRPFKKDIAVALDALSRADAGKTKQRVFAENLVNDALAGNRLAIKILTAIALKLDSDEGEREGEVTPLQQQLIDDFNHREASTESMEGGENASEIS